MYQWASRTTDKRALQTPNGRSRFAACYHTSLPGVETSFDIELRFTDRTTAHLVALYCLDWDRQDRQQRIQVLDLDTDSLLSKVEIDGNNAMAGGIYQKWEVTGPVRIRVTHIAPFNALKDNAVVSGVFFGPVSSP
jgi:hypothetical protein